MFVLTPLDSGEEHLNIMRILSSTLLDEKRRSTILNATNEDEVLGELVRDEKVISVSASKGLIIGVTGCAVGVAHTYIAAEALTKQAKEMGYDVKIETNGSIGVENGLTKQDIAQAVAVVVASDKETPMARFNGKKLLECPVKKAVDNPKMLIEKALEAPIYSGGKVSEETNSVGNAIYKHLMNGVSYMVPFVIIGGILIAISLALGGEPTDAGLVIPEGHFLNQVLNLGSIGFTLMVPILAGYIAVSIGDRSALAPGMIGGWIANDGSFYNSEVGMGFVGAIIAGFLVGYFVKLLKNINYPKLVKPLVPIMIIPLSATLFIGFIFIGLIGQPVASLLDQAYKLLENLSTGGWIVIGIVIGAMQGFDYGGAFGKVAFLFSMAMIGEGHPEFMGAQAVAIPVAPLGMGIATLIDKKKKYFDEQGRGNGTAALAMGLVGISEGAIPFAAKNPLVVIPATVIGSITACVLGFAMGITNTVPHGGPIVLLLGVVNKPLIALLCMVIGSIVTALVYILLAKRQLGKKKIQSV